MISVGNPVPTFAWTHEGKPVTSSDVNHSSTVVISGVRVGDFGFYILEMHNEYGTANFTYFLQADGEKKPKLCK